MKVFNNPLQEAASKMNLNSAKFQNLTPSQRIYTDHHSGLKFRMYVNNDTHEKVLINEATGCQLREFYAAAFNGIDYKFKDGSIITLNVGEFFTPHCTTGRPISKRFSSIQKRFSKI